jgi:nickel-dependent lactate racemase
MHHASTPGELVEMLGEQTCARYRIESHVGRDSSSHRYLGETRGGIPVWIDQRYLDADLRIATGLVEPHLMAGYSGGRKAICPGICGVETLRPWHGPELLESQRAAPGVLEGNPVHDEAVAIARMAGCDFAVNVVLNSERKAAALFAGAIEEVFLAAVQAFDHIGAIPVEAPAPIVVTSSAGYPLDITWYQAVKGLAGALPAVEPGGTIIMAAGLREGMGADEFAQLTWRMRSFDQFMEELRRPDFFVIDQWQLEEMAKVARRARIKVFSEGLSPADLRRALVEPVRSVEEGIQEALEMYGRRAGIIVIPEGPYVLPRPRPAPGAQRGARRV